MAPIDVNSRANLNVDKNTSSRFIKGTQIETVSSYRTNNQTKDSGLLPPIEATSSRHQSPIKILEVIDNDDVPVDPLSSIQDNSSIKRRLTVNQKNPGQATYS